MEGAGGERESYSVCAYVKVRVCVCRCGFVSLCVYKHASLDPTPVQGTQKKAPPRARLCVRMHARACVHLHTHLTAIRVHVQRTKGRARPAQGCLRRARVIDIASTAEPQAPKHRATSGGPPPKASRSPGAQSHTQRPLLPTRRLPLPLRPRPRAPATRAAAQARPVQGSAGHWRQRQAPPHHRHSRRVIAGTLGVLQTCVR